MKQIGRGALLTLGVFAMSLVAPAFAGKNLVKLDQESETGRGHIGFGLGGTRSPTNGFLLKVNSKPKGVKVNFTGQILCAPKKGSIARTEPATVTRKAPYQFRVEPTIKRNRFCDLTGNINVEAETRTTVTGKVFHKR
jgi:hypothetical protein